MNLKSLLADKRVRYGSIAGVAGIGAFAWYRNRNASAAAASSGTSTDGSGSTTPSAYVPGSFPDTSGTDVASWLGDNEAAFMKELQDYQAGLPAPASPAPPTTPSPVSPTPPGLPIKKPPTGPKPTKGPPVVNVAAYSKTNTSPYSTLSGLVGVAKSKFGITTSVAQLEKLNNLPNSTIRTGESLKL